MAETTVRSEAMKSESSTKKVVIRPLQMVLGALAAFGILVLLQQYGVTTFTTVKLVVALILGAVFGFGLSNLSGMMARSRASKAMKEEAK